MLHFTAAADRTNSRGRKLKCMPLTESSQISRSVNSPSAGGYTGTAVLECRSKYRRARSMWYYGCPRYIREPAEEDTLDILPPALLLYSSGNTGWRMGGFGLGWRWAATGKQKSRNNRTQTATSSAFRQRTLVVTRHSKRALEARERTALGRNETQKQR